MTLTDAEVLTVFRAAEEAGFDVPTLLVTAGDAANPSGVGIGRRIEYPDGRVMAHCECFIVRQQFRGVKSLAILGELHRKWSEMARAFGAEQLITSVERSRPEVVALVRRYGYQPYAIDDEHVWYRRAA